MLFSRRSPTRLAAVARPLLQAPRRRGYSAPPAALNYCVDVVRNHDNERYLCNLHAPTEARIGLFALHAFNYETARIRSTTTGEHAAKARILWWRSALDSALEGNPPDHPVARALAHVASRYPLTPRYLTQLIDAREADLHVKQPKALDDLQLYCERTAGSLLLLGLECSGVVGSEEAELAAFHAGTALGMATLLRGTAAHAAQGCTYLPAEVTRRHGVRLSAMLRGEASAEVRDAIAEVADEAVTHLLAARSMRDDVPIAGRAALLPATIADQILLRLQRGGYDPFAAGMREPLGVRLQLALLWNRVTSRY